MGDRRVSCGFQYVEAFNAAHGYVEQAHDHFFKMPVTDGQPLLAVIQIVADGLNRNSGVNIDLGFILPVGRTRLKGVKPSDFDEVVFLEFGESQFMHHQHVKIVRSSITWIWRNHVASISDQCF